MHLYSTSGDKTLVSLKEAVMRGLAPDGGLYMPESFPTLAPEVIESFVGKPFPEIANTVAQELFRNDLSSELIEEIVTDALTFDVPLVPITDNISTLELFHGPTLAFKDVAARFMARLMSHYVREDGNEVTILVATSGDTGSAVAHGFLGVPGISVVILYPSGKVSGLQEKQLTTMGQNITALEVDGTFDDCQKLVKEAFNDDEIRAHISPASANSINIARLLPQSLYFFHGFAQAREKGIESPIVFSVPSGNYGDLCAGLIAKRMGLPVDKFVAAMNANDTVLEYLSTGTYEPKPSVATISNAMDVGNPSNFVRMLELYGHDVDAMSAEIVGYSYTDDQTRATIRDVFKEHAYTLDPHGAVGFLGAQEYQSDYPGAHSIFIETAHPAKFKDTVESEIDESVEVPERLAQYDKREKQSILIENDFDVFKNYLLNR